MVDVIIIVLILRVVFTARVKLDIDWPVMGKIVKVNLFKKNRNMLEYLLKISMSAKKTAIFVNTIVSIPMEVTCATVSLDIH